MLSGLLRAMSGELCAAGVRWACDRSEVSRRTTPEYSRDPLEVARCARPPPGVNAKCAVARSSANGEGELWRVGTGL